MALHACLQNAPSPSTHTLPHFPTLLQHLPVFLLAAANYNRLHYYTLLQQPLPYPLHTHLPPRSA